MVDIHILTLKPTNEAKSLKDADGGSKKEKQKRKSVERMQPARPAPADHPMTAANIPHRPSHREMAHDSVHAAMRDSMRRWVGGEISTSKHKENMRRGMSALKAIPKIREGGY